MAVRNDIRLAAAGPIDGVTKFPQWFEDHRGVRLELVARPDPMAPAIGDIPEPGSPVVHPTNFPEESFYFMAEARLQVAGNGTIGRARVIMALEAAFGGDEEPETSIGGPNPGVVFARLRVRMEDVVPGETYVVRHPYGETRPLIADERGRVAYTCDLGVSENDLNRVLVSGEIAPFLAWTAPLPNGYIGDGVTEHAVAHGRFRNHVEIAGTGIGVGSADALGVDLVSKALFTVQGRLAGTGATLPPPPLGGPGISVLDILDAEYRTSRRQLRVRGTLLPVSIGDGAGGYTSDRVDVTIPGYPTMSAFPDVTGAWTVRKTLVTPGAPIPGPLTNVQVRTASQRTGTRLLTIRN